MNMQYLFQKFFGILLKIFHGREEEREKEKPCNFKVYRVFDLIYSETLGKPAFWALSWICCHSASLAMKLRARRRPVEDFGGLPAPALAPPCFGFLGSTGSVLGLSGSGVVVYGGVVSMVHDPFLCGLDYGMAYYILFT
jgi:hypothetical protein